MLEPTEDLFNIAIEKSVFYTFFVDVGFLIKAEEYPELSEDLNHVKFQVKQMIELGHDVQLHIHPHWEKAEWNNGSWEMNVNGAYKLSDFEENEIVLIVKKYKAYLDNLIGRKTTTFRAGGWCIQPFSKLKDVFIDEGISVDSSVFPGAYLQTDDYYFNFLDAPTKSKYKFENDVCVEDKNGSFTEYPITSFRYSPLFFWRLYILGRLFPSKYKMIGDGNFISQGSRKIHVLTSYSTYHVSSDGYYATKLNQSLDKSMNMKRNEMVVIGHPKGNTKDSLKRLRQFISRNKERHNFTTFSRISTHIKN